MRDSDFNVWDGTVVTNEGLKNLRKAVRNSSVRWYAERTAGRAGILASVQESTPSGRVVQTTIFANTEHRLDNYGPQLSVDWTAFGSIDSEAMVTVLAFIRAGDELKLVFGRDSHASETLKEANLHGDSVKLQVIRDTKVYRFILDVTISPDNSARLVRTS